MGLQVNIPSLLEEEGEIANCGFRSRQDHHIGIARKRLAGRHEPDLHVRLLGEGIEIVEIGDPGDDRNGDLQPA